MARSASRLNGWRIARRYRLAEPGPSARGGSDGRFRIRVTAWKPPSRGPRMLDDDTLRFFLDDQPLGGQERRYALGGFVPLRSNFGLELAIGNNPDATGKTFDQSYESSDSSIYKIHPYSNASQQDRLRSMGELAFMQDMQRVAVRWMADHPAETLRLSFNRFRCYWFSGG